MAEIITRIREYNQGTPLRPAMTFQDGMEVQPMIPNLIVQCWEEEPNSRPSFENINKSLQKELSRLVECCVQL